MKMSTLLTVVFLGFMGVIDFEATAQISAVTESGEEVVLYNNGTWRYLEDSTISTEEIYTNTEKFEKPKGSTFLLKSQKLNIGVWLDPKKWSFKKASSNESAEFELQSKVGDLYGMLIAEEIEVPLETLKTVAFDNGREVSPDLKIVKQEYRTVNGLKTLLLQMEGSMQGIKFTYYGYYFSSASGSLQFVTYTSQGLFSKFQSECDMLLNGLVEVK